jgi:putative DNA primase/helicase
MNLYDEMARAGIRCEERIVADGNIHRFRVNGKRQKNGWYVFHERGSETFGAFGDWATGFSTTIGAKTPEIREVLRKVVDHGIERAKTAAQKAHEELLAASQTSRSTYHLYLARKCVQAYDGVRINGRDQLLIPMSRCADGLAGVQRIDNDGQKRFSAGMKKLGSWFGIAGVGSTIVLCEGYATGASIHMATRLPVVVAFDCGNLLAAARDFEGNGRVKWIVAADNDHASVGNPGLTKGFEVAHELNGRLAVPLGTSGTDFNDLHIEHGIAAVVDLIYGCL